MRRIKLVDVGSRSRKKVNAYKFLTYDELRDMLSRLNSKQLYVMITLMFETGLRASEITDLKGENIDLIGRSISGIGKGNKEFNIIISEPMADLLSQWFKIVPIEEYPFKILQRAKPILRRNQAQALHEYMAAELNKIGFKHVTPHMIRHTFGHYLRHDKHMDIMLVKTHLRHESITSTEIYAPVTKEEADDAMRKIVFREDVTKPKEITPETREVIDYAAKLKSMSEKLKDDSPMVSVVIYGDKHNYYKKITEAINYHRKENLVYHPSKFGLTTAIQNKKTDRLASRHVAWSIHYTDQI